MIEVNVNVRLEFGLAAELLFKSMAASLLHGPAPVQPNSVGPAPRNGADAEVASNGQSPAAPAAGVSSLNLPPEPKAPAVFSQPGAKHPRDKWSDDRVALLIEMRAEGHDWHTIMSEVNCLAGPPVTTANAVSVKFHKLRLEGILPPRVLAVAKVPEVVAEPPLVVASVPEVVAKAPEPVAPLPPVAPAPAPAPPPAAAKPLSGHKIRVSIDEARAWAAQRGICNGFESDLDMKVVNTKRVALGLPLFELQRGRGA
ncbi:hypothetical protein [Acidocella sp.]|uniref:hypothetical protein n=1 Tax=Acidocella sp. TaxID=50710 RepID=UPI002605AE39|nr:hypothetical protein [Acidocella sp.]MDD2794380.1 hypothetical protein [Acidocella sp.]